MTKLEAYNEAKNICERHINYTGDKRTSLFKQLERSVTEAYIGRMNAMGKQLGLPGYIETFYK